MKICYLCLTSPWDKRAGGGAIITHKIATKMAELGHMVYVVYTRAKEMLPIPKVNYKIIWARHFETPYLNVFTLFFASFGLLLRERFDIINGVEGEPVLLAALFNKRSIFVTTAHFSLIPNIRPPLFIRRPVCWLKNIRDNMRYHCIKMSMKFSKFSVATSRFSRQNVSEELGISPDKITIIPNGADAEFLKYDSYKKDNTQEKTIVCVGRLDDQKGIDILIRALANVSKRQPVRTIIVGTGWKEAEFKGLASSLGISERIDFVGRVPHEEIPDYIRKADLFVLPSRRDNCPLSILEAMAVGVPIIATRVGGIPELIQDGVTGILVQKEDVQGLSDAIIDLLDNPAKREYLAKNAKKSAAENFTWDIAASRYDAFYKSLVKNYTENMQNE